MQDINLRAIDDIFTDVNTGVVIPFVTTIKEYMINNNINMPTLESNPFRCVMANHIQDLITGCDEFNQMEASILNKHTQILESIKYGTPLTELYKNVQLLANKLYENGCTGSIISQVSTDALTEDHFVELEIIKSGTEINENENENEIEVMDEDEVMDENDVIIRELHEKNEETFVIFVNESFEQKSNAVYSASEAVLAQFKLLVSIRNLNLTTMNTLKFTYETIETLTKLDTKLVLCLVLLRRLQVEMH